MPWLEHVQSFGPRPCELPRPAPHASTTPRADAIVLDAHDINTPVVDASAGLVVATNGERPPATRALFLRARGRLITPLFTPID